MKARRQLAALYEGGFLKRAENVLTFGLPGRGKTHVLCALGHDLVHHATILELPQTSFREQAEATT